MNTHTCANCKTNKSLLEFGKDKATPSGYSYYCKLCNTARSKAYRQRNLEVVRAKQKTAYHRNPDKHQQVTRIWRENNKHTDKYKRAYKNYRLKETYGITVDQYEAMLIAQNHSCWICKKDEVAIESRTGTVKKLCVDHDHDTGSIRGLLCTKCNMGIGMFKHDAELLKMAALYIQEKSL